MINILKYVFEHGTEKISILLLVFIFHCQFVVLGDCIFILFPTILSLTVNGYTVKLPTYIKEQLLGDQVDFFSYSSGVFGKINLKIFLKLFL